MFRLAGNRLRCCLAIRRRLFFLCNSEFLVTPRSISRDRMGRLVVVGISSGDQTNDSLRGHIRHTIRHGRWPWRSHTSHKPKPFCYHFEVWTHFYVKTLFLFYMFCSRDAQTTKMHATTDKQWYLIERTIAKRSIYLVFHSNLTFMKRLLFPLLIEHNCIRVECEFIFWKARRFDYSSHRAPHTLDEGPATWVQCIVFRFCFS